jgi:hypothetical protein
VPRPAIGVTSSMKTVFRGDGQPTVRLTFRGLRDSKTTVDRDTRVTRTLPAAQAERLWRLLGEKLTDAEVQVAEA